MCKNTESFSHEIIPSPSNLHDPQMKQISGFNTVINRLYWAQYLRYVYIGN